jgi:hypothetical protein
MTIPVERLFSLGSSVLAQAQGRQPENHQAVAVARSIGLGNWAVTPQYGSGLPVSSLETHCKYA